MTVVLSLLSYLSMLPQILCLIFLTGMVAFFYPFYLFSIYLLSLHLLSLVFLVFKNVGVIYFKPFRLLFELLLPIKNPFLLDFKWFYIPTFFKEDVIEATELDMFLFLEFEDVKPNFLVFYPSCELVGVRINLFEFIERIIS